MAEVTSFCASNKQEVNLKKQKRWKHTNRYAPWDWYIYLWVGWIYGINLSKCFIIYKSIWDLGYQTMDVLGLFHALISHLTLAVWVPWILQQKDKLRTLAPLDRYVYHTTHCRSRKFHTPQGHHVAKQPLKRSLVNDIHSPSFTCNLKMLVFKAGISGSPGAIFRWTIPSTLGG